MTADSQPENLPPVAADGPGSPTQPPAPPDEVPPPDTDSGSAAPVAAADYAGGPGVQLWEVVLAQVVLGLILSYCVVYRGWGTERASRRDELEILHALFVSALVVLAAVDSRRVPYERFHWSGRVAILLMFPKALYTLFPLGNPNEALALAAGCTLFIFPVLAMFGPLLFSGLNLYRTLRARPLWSCLLMALAVVDYWRNDWIRLFVWGGEMR